MNVDHPVSKSLEHHRRKETIVTGENDQIDSLLLKEFRDRGVAGGSLAVGLVREHPDRKIRSSRSLHRWRFRVIAGNRDDVGGNPSGSRIVDHCLKVTASTGDQHAKPQMPSRWTIGCVLRSLV